MDDRRLLDRYLADRDEAAFRELVDRHLDLVHSVASRVTANRELARDISQATFVRLAERAATVPRGLSLTAWLHRTSRSLAIDLVRAEERRKHRERASLQNEAMTTSPDPGWEQLAPLVDELVDNLPAADRELVLAKYYRNEPHARIAAQLGCSEANARKRASRALEKLRAQLVRRGIPTSAAALAVLLPAHAVTPAPAALAGAVAAA
uniref:RNA polymerase sigma factor n=1 Tax=Luteolibacter marinus TaxID=2776705 RepID=UPI001865C88E